MIDLRAHRWRPDRPWPSTTCVVESPGPSREIEGDAIVSDAMPTASSFRS